MNSGTFGESRNGRKVSLYCIPSFGGGGAERQLCYLANSSIGMGFATHIAYIHDGPNLKVLDQSGVVLHRLSARSNYDPMILLQLVKLIREVRPFLIQTWISQMDVMGGLAGLFTKTPFILSERSSALAYRRNWKDRLRVYVGLRAAAVVANSEAGKSYWQGLGYQGRTQVIRNVVPMSEIERAPCADPGDYGIPKGSRLIVFAGRYSEEKNIILLLEAVTRVIRERSDVAALLFGEGPLRGEIERWVSESGLGARIKIGGYCESLWALMKAADVFVSVSAFEGHPNTVLEAMAARCPLVVSDIPEHREFLDESSAYLTRPSSIADVADAVARALDNRTEARAKADAAFRAAAKWSAESQTSEYIDLYRKILGDGFHFRHRQ